MNECLELHKALSEAEVEYQRKADAVKEIESLHFPPNITNIEQLLEEWDRLKAEESVAYEKREAIGKAYKECLKRQTKVGQR